MKRSGLFVATPFTLLVTGLTLAWAGWLTPHPRAAAAPRPGDAAALAAPADPFASEAAWHWRACAPHHWHSCLLQH